MTLLIVPIEVPHLPESDADNLEAMLAETAEMITNAKQPVIVADVELHRHGLSNLAISIAEKFNIPVASTLLSKSIISEHHLRSLLVAPTILRDEVTGVLLFGWQPAALHITEAQIDFAGKMAALVGFALASFPVR